MQKLRRETDIWVRKASLKAGNDLEFNKECGGGRTEVVQSRTCLCSHDFTLMPRDYLAHNRQ